MGWVGLEGKGGEISRRDWFVFLCSVFCLVLVLVLVFVFEGRWRWRNMEIWKRRQKQDKEWGVEKCKIMRIKKLFRFVFSSLTGGQAGDIST